MCLGYAAFIFALCFICISSLFGSGRADSPRAEYIGFPASSVYCLGFLAEAEAMPFYLLVFFWFDSRDFGRLPPRVPETSLPFRCRVQTRPLCRAAGSLLHPGGLPEAPIHVFFLSTDMVFQHSALLGLLKIAQPRACEGGAGKGCRERCPITLRHPAVVGIPQPGRAPVLMGSKRRDLETIRAGLEVGSHIQSMAQNRNQ